MADSRSKENRRERGKRGALRGDGDRGLCRGNCELMDVVETPGVNNGLDRKEGKRKLGANRRPSVPKTAWTWIFRCKKEEDSRESCAGSFRCYWKHSS